MKTPAGKLIPIGGNEARDYGERADSEQDVDFDNGILKDVLEEIGKEDAVIEVLTIASKQQKEIAEDYTEAFRKLGFNIGVILDKDKLDSEKILERLSRADCLFITGGDQKRLKRMLEGTSFMKLLRKKYLSEDFVLAGTSAGAMILSESTIDDGDSEESLLKGIMNVSEGLGFLPGTIIDTHFLKRGRISRLVEALLMKRNCVGIGLCEDTAIVISEGNIIRPIGSGSVTIIQPFEIGATNFYRAKENESVYVENLKFHILAKGMNYFVREKKLYGLEMVPA